MIVTEVTQADSVGRVLPLYTRPEPEESMDDPHHHPSDDSRYAQRSDADILHEIGMDDEAEDLGSAESVRFRRGVGMGCACQRCSRRRRRSRGRVVRSGGRPVGGSAPRAGSSRS